jgi:hydrogenase 3 maturation protease
MGLKETLRQRLDGARRVAVLAVGSRLRGDDEAGLLVADALETRDQPTRIPLSIFMGETTPENLTGEIRAYSPSHVVIVDAADLGKRPGTVELVPPDAPSLSTSASTHSLPLEVLANYLRTTVGCDVVILGIQPASIDFGLPPCPAVRQAARRAAAAIVQTLSLIGERD